ncbi:unnamed protein product, partial [Tetraodon nigroviridis]
EEPLLKENPRRFVIFPIQYQDLWQMYKKAEASFWTAEEVDLSKDLQHWESLKDDERFFISHVLAFFAASDGIVNENLVERFTQEVQVTEARCFYGFQIAMENIHSEMYSLLIDTYIKEPSEREYLFNAIETLPCVKKKADWALNWIGNQKASYGERPAHAGAPRPRPRRRQPHSLPVLCSRRARGGLCRRGGNLLLGLLCRHLLAEEARPDARPDLLQRADQQRRGSALRLRLSDVQAPAAQTVGTDGRRHHQERRGDRAGVPDRGSARQADRDELPADEALHRVCGRPPAAGAGFAKTGGGAETRRGRGSGSPVASVQIYRAENPFDFMENISLEGKTNFFEKRVGEYQRMGVMAGAADNTFRLDADF